ncbi:orotate phosphoribosyltransferase [Dactylosporangium sp. NPDC051541]|uniref:orotate phosphoribosyltransferase n=1 Tax=Dactylosporangium sp. NPDC051541 TaxID=3363977 RepID=UPI003795C247
MTSPANDLFSQPGHASFQHDDDRRRELGQDIMAAAYLRGDFVLRSGARSSYYFDKYLFETKPTIMRRLAEFLARRVPGDVARLAGPELGAVALAAAVSLETGLPFVIVRKQVKQYATGSAIEGELHPGERVLIIEDVVSSGGEALAAAQKLRAAGVTVVGVLAVIDRQSGGGENINAAGMTFDALFRLDQLV